MMTTMTRTKSSESALASSTAPKAADDPRPSHFRQLSAAPPPESVALALGSNEGDRLVHLRRAVSGLSHFIHVVAVSSVWETAPLGCRPGDGAFLNLVLAGWTRRSPEALLDVIAELEQAGGRHRGRLNDPRTIDIDLVFYGNRAIRQASLTVPHPRFRERNFVLEPLREIARAVRVPSFERELRVIRGEGEVRRVGALY
jgi:2-amino-4-hydroxy-6-hydroxymethyldihydropteridine diphosphokinase